MVLAWMPLALGRKGEQRSRRTVSELSSTIETVGFTSESRTSRVILAGRGVFFLAKRKEEGKDFVSILEEKEAMHRGYGKWPLKDTELLLIKNLIKIVPEMSQPFSNFAALRIVHT